MGASTTAHRPSNSLHLLKHYFTQHPEDADKDGSPEGIRASVEKALAMLDGVKKIDIFECARVDRNVPIETSIATLAQLVKEGKIGGVGISEASAETIRRAHAVHLIAAAEIELSLFTTDPLRNGIVDVCRELSISVFAYSPLGRGWLTGQIRQYSDLAENDMRRMLPRFQPDVFEDNFRLIEAIEDIARQKGVSIAQVAIAWVRAQGAIPIPGATTEERVLENFRDVTLTPEELGKVQSVLDGLEIKRATYGGQHEKLLNL
ncbi:NADP-dependent oxidoreductase domain-containing protein [Aspergillus terricola var. indicus]